MGGKRTTRHRGARPALRSAAALLLGWGLLYAAVVSGPGPLLAQDPAPGDVVGTLTAPDNGAVAGSEVVLMKFRLNEQGVPVGEPFRTQRVAADGAYRFEGVPGGNRSVYQLQAEVGGQTLRSGPFPIPPQGGAVTVDLRVPKVVTDRSRVQLAEAALVIDPQSGGAWVTEVVHIMNRGQDVVDGTEQPLRLHVPEGAEQFEVVRELPRQERHERLGATLLVYGDLPPGQNTLAYRYRLPVWFRSLHLEKRYPDTVGLLNIFVPEGSLQVDGLEYAKEPVHTFEQARYDRWSRRGIAANAPFTVPLAGFPMQQQVLLVPGIVFFVAMAGVVGWFLRRRLRNAPEEDPTADAA